MSTRVTSGFAVRTRLVTGSEAATGKLAHVWTVRATLVPSTSTCSTARCSLSVATITTESSAITYRRFQRRDYLPLSNFPLSIKGLGFWGGAGCSVLGEIRRTVHNTISSELLFCKLLLRKRLPRTGRSPSPGILL